MKPQFCPSSRAQWRAWLQENHACQSEVWLVFFKQHTGRASISYRDSLEEALCFGWIDGLKRRIDDARYACRFTPRKAKSKWSPLNIRLAKNLIEQGKMTAAGMAAYERRQPYDEQLLEKREQAEVGLPPEAERALRKNTVAWRNYQRLAPGYRKQYALWLASARRAETRERRLREALALLENSEKLGMK